MKICVDMSKCIGSGMCEAMAPAVFTVLEDGTLHIRDDHPGEDQAAAVMEAISVCPTTALSVVEE